jgi:hypothetical protein
MNLNHNKMKRLLLIVVASLFLVQMADAQLFRFGIKGGLGYSTLKFDDLMVTSGQEAYELVTGDGVMAYHVGIQTQIKLAMFFVQPELYFKDGGGTIKSIESGGAEEIKNVDLKSMDLPILAGVKLGPLRLYGGLVGTYVLNDGTISLEFDGIAEDYTVYSSAMTWGFQAGLGVGFSKVSLDARYEGSLSKLGDSFTVGGADFNLDTRPSQWVFSLGFWFR